jgi:hypothetical protein
MRDKAANGAAFRFGDMDIGNPHVKGAKKTHQRPDGMVVYVLMVYVIENTIFCKIPQIACFKYKNAIWGHQVAYGCDCTPQA